MKKSTITVIVVAITVAVMLGGLSALSRDARAPSTLATDGNTSGQKLSVSHDSDLAEPLTILYTDEGFSL